MTDHNNDEKASKKNNLITASNLSPKVIQPNPDLIIKSEDDALEYINNLIVGNASEIKHIRFEGWPIFNIKLEGKPYHGTITPTAMNGILSIQREINRSYTVAKYGDSKLHSLTDDERQTLELQIKVENGSANFLSDNADAIINKTFGVLNNMESSHIAFLGAVFALCFFGSKISKYYFQNKKNIRELELDADQASAVRDQAKFMSDAETNRLQVLTDFILKDRKASQILESSNIGRDEFLRSIKSVDSADIQGAVISVEFIQEINASERRSFELKNLERLCRVLRVDSTNETKLKIKIQLEDTHQQLDAELEDQTMDARHKQGIRNALFDRKPLTLLLEARTFGSQLKDVKILGTKSSENPIP